MDRAMREHGCIGFTGKHRIHKPPQRVRRFHRRIIKMITDDGTIDRERDGGCSDGGSNNAMASVLVRLCCQETGDNLTQSSVQFEHAIDECTCTEPSLRELLRHRIDDHVSRTARQWKWES
jgi:hypothetical protein